MSISTLSKALTFEDFCVLVKDGQKGDLINGVIYMASPDNTDANELSMWLGHLVSGFVDQWLIGKTYGSRVAFRLGPENSPEPDLAVVLTARLHLVQRGFVDGPPDLAVEIVSPDSVERDYDLKREQYQRAGVPEYWIIDELEQRVLWLRLAGRRRYREIRPQRGVLHSHVLPGFWLRPEWLWQTPRPSMRRTLAEILGEA
jgi:Uma2 family endonuclease